MKKKTQTQIINEKNAKKIKKMKQDQIDSAEQHNRVRRGELTAGEALMEISKKKKS